MKLDLSLFLLGILLGPLVCQGNLNSCRNVDGFELPGEQSSSYLSYIYTADADGNCDGVVQVCNATVTDTNLRGRSWFIDNTRSDSGLFYKPLWLQIYNIQCPRNTILHLFPQFLDTESDFNSACTGFDFVSITVPNRDQEILCGGEDARVSSDLFNAGLGILVEEGNATVEFCTNGNLVQNLGFAIRATCVDPTTFNHPNCKDFEFFDLWDGDFVRRIDNPFLDPEKVNVLHKRSIKKKMSKEDRKIMRLLKHRQKRFDRDFEQAPILIESDTRVTYRDGELTILFRNGTSITFERNIVVASNDVVSTRIYFKDFPPGLIVVGPGEVRVYDNFVQVSYTIGSLAELITPPLEVAAIINRIYDYTYLNYISNYPVIEETPSEFDDPNFITFPLPAASLADFRYRSLSSIDFILEDIQSGTCRRAAIVDRVPARVSMIDSNINDFCRFFFDSCNPLLAIACREAVNLDRLSGRK